ncbi:MAG: hypothetical protein GXY34_12350 [Syntrophomonadaceae bacterium]|nr:hypothetical protein [Syntrophomonadaceae bacterium]
MGLTLKTAPKIEPLSLAEVKAHLRLDSDDLDSAVTTNQSIAPASHIVAAAYSLEGAAVEVIGYRVLALLEAGDCSAGTVTVKLQDRDSVSESWVDVTGGAFAAVTSANDNLTYELEYTSGKRYLRAVATVATGACVFGVSIQTFAGETAEDALLSALTTAAREWCQDYQNRAYITQTWELTLDAWPSDSFIELPLPPLQKVNSVIYKDTAGTSTTWDDDNYIFQTDTVKGRVVLAYGCSWPTEQLYPAGGIIVNFDCGYGDAADVPQTTRQAMLLLISTWYENREATTPQQMQEPPFAVKALLGMNRVIPV